MPYADACRFRYSIVVLLSVGALMALPWDVYLARFFLSDPFPGEVRSLIHKAEFFGHAYGILGITFTLYLVAEARRRFLARLLFCAFAAGIACDFVKLAVHRVRPIDFDFGSASQTFLGLSFLHVDNWQQVFASSYHSFPSAHTATSVAFACALGGLYPLARRWFLALAVMVAVSRFDGGAHYVSDTFVGGMIGYLTACWVLGPTRLSAWFDRFEQTGRLPAWTQRLHLGGTAEPTRALG